MVNQFTSRPQFSVENFNQMLESVYLDNSKHPALTNDWRNLISSELVLTEDQTNYLQNLEQKSIRMMQLAFRSIIHSGGRIYMERNLETGTTDVIAENIRIFRPNISIRVCRFDGFFRRCRWFPKS